MSSADYDPRYPFGKPSRQTNRTKAASASASRSKQAPKKESSQSKEASKVPGVKQGSPLKNTFVTLAILGALGAAGYFGYNWYQDNQEKTQPEPSQAQAAEEVLHCPVYQKGIANPTQAESEAYGRVIAGLDAHERFPEELRRAIVHETLLGLDNGMGKAEALERAEQALFQGIAKDANINIFERNGIRHCVGTGLSRLETNFSMAGAVAVQTKDVPLILRSIPFSLETLKANLDAYSAEEARTMLKVFGTTMLCPNLGREASRYVNKNTEWLTGVQMQVFRETSQRISEDTKNTPPHDIICQAVKAVFENTQTPEAFFTYAQTAKILHGKTRSQMVSALSENLTQLREYPQGWMSQNAGWLNPKTPATMSSQARRVSER